MYILLFFIIFILIMQVSLWNAIFNLNEIVFFFFLPEGHLNLVWQVLVDM